MFLLSVLCLGLIFGSLFVFKKAPSAASYSYYEPLGISKDSLNGNSIWGGGEAFEAIASSGGLDGITAFYSTTNKTAGGLDSSGALSLGNIPYQLTWTGASDYTGNDTIKLYHGHKSASVAFDTIGAYSKFYILSATSLSSEEGQAILNVTAHYTDGSSSQTSYQLCDLHNPASSPDTYSWPGLASRIIVSEQTYDGSTTSAPYLQSTVIDIDAKKLVSSIDLNLADQSDESAITGIYAITGMVNVAAPNPVESIHIGDVAESNATISWQTTTGATSYRLDLATDVYFKHILPDYNNLYTQDDFASLTGLTGNTTYYVRIRAENTERQSINSDVVNFTTDPETTPPTISIAANPGLIQIQDEAVIIGTDASGISYIEESLDSGATWDKLADGDRAKRTITENGTYCYRAADSYGNISEISCITYTNLDTTKPVISINTNGYKEGEWTNSPITMSVETLTTNVGQTRYYYSEDSTDWTVFDGTMIFNDETGGDGKTYYFKAINQANIESNIVSLTIRRDATAPTGEITSSNNGWNQFLNTITFGLFFHETKNFNIAASDDLSGIDHVEYLVSDRAFDSKETAISVEGWDTTPGLVTVDPEQDFILYFKIVDKAGNISVINTDGIVLDTTSASIRGYVDADHTYSLQDGKTYYLIHKLLIEDDRALDSISINDQAISLQNSNIIDLAPDQAYSITATDKAGNVASLTIKTSAITDLDLHITSDNYKTSDYSDLSSARAELLRIKDTESDHATIDERETITALIATYDELLHQIADLDARLVDQADRFASTPDIDRITYSNREDIQALIDNVETIFDSSSLHLSIEETNDLLVQRHELENKLLHLDAVAADLDSLDIIIHTDIDTVKTEDKAELEALKTTAEALLAGGNLTDGERTSVETELDVIHRLLDRIDEAVAAKDTDAIRAVSTIVPTGYTVDDEAALLSAKSDLESAIGRYGYNYSSAEKQTLNDQLIAVEFAISDIGNQTWEETRRTTFPTISTINETDRWTTIDTVGVSATDDYGIDKLEISSDGGQTWDLVSTYDSSTVDITQNGAYLFRATNEFGNTATRAVTYNNVDSVVPVISVDTHGYAPGSWTNQPVTISIVNSADNVSPVTLYYREVSTTDSENDWLPYTTSLIVSEDTASRQFEFKGISSAGVESAIERIEVKKDSIVPTGTISTGTNTVNSVLHTITFGLLFNETKTFELSASDAHSGVKTIEYIVSESELTEAELADTSNWLATNGTVSVDPNKPAIVYYRITDHAGNVSVITLSGITFELPGLSEAGITVTTEGDNSATLATSSGSITLLSDLEHTTIDDLATLNSIKAELSNYLEKHPDDTSGIVNSIASDYAQAIETLEGVENGLASIRTSYNGINIGQFTPSDKSSILALINTINGIEASNSNHLTTLERQELNNKLEVLYAASTNIESTQAELEAINASVSSYSISTVTKDDLASLASLKTRINELLNNPNVADSDKEHLQELLATIAELEARIAEAEKALEEAKENDHTGGINSGNVTPADQTSLEDAARAYAEALGVFDSNLSLSDLFDINNRIAIINSALDILDQVAEFEAMVSRLPNPEDVNYNSRLLIKAAEGAYDALSEYGRSLVGPSLLARYRAVLESYRAYLEGSPLLYAFETLDIFWWGLSTFAVMGIFIFIVRHTHKHYVDASDSDEF